MKAEKKTKADSILAGGSGLIGRELAALWAQHRSADSTLHLLLRKEGGVPAPNQRVHRVDFSALPALPAAKEAFCCLGTTIAVAGSQDAFRAVDHGAVLAFARAAKKAGVTRFAVVSALGADAASRAFYTRVKGEMENDLKALRFSRLLIARPSLLAGDRGSLGQALRLGERLALAVTAPLKPLIPLAWRPIHAQTVARALLVGLARAQDPVQVLESKDLQRLGALK